MDQIKEEAIKKIEHTYNEEIIKRLKLLNQIQAPRPPLLLNIETIQSLFLMPFKMDLNPITSSNIEAFGYEVAAETLAVRFKGGAEYRYLGVKPHEAIGFNEAQSKGTYLGAVIKTAKNYIKMPKEN